MKVGRWKVLALAGVLTLGYVATTDAAQIKVSDETWANFGLNMKIWYRHLDERLDNGDWSKNEFSVDQTKIYFVGQVTKLFQFYTEIDTAKDLDASGTSALGEGAINFAFAPEFQVQVGKVRKPFTRYSIVSGYAEVIPTGYFADPQGVLGVTKLAISDRVDRGLVLHGDLAGGILNYRIGIFNENRSNATKIFTGSSWTGSAYSGKLNDKKNFEWAARIEFQPLMLGFKNDSAATITAKTAETTLGTKDIFVIGLGYNKEKHTPKLTLANDKDLDRTGWTIDATFEKKYGNLVPNLQLAYISLDESHFYNKGGVYKKGDTDAYYVRGQLLYDQVVGLGKPALALRYENIEADGETGTKNDLTVKTWGIALNYYIKGQAARVSLGFDTTKYEDAAKAYLKNNGKEDRITDWYIYFQSQF